MVPLVAAMAEEIFKKTVHRNDILHAKQLVRDIGFDDNIGHSSRNAETSDEGKHGSGSDRPTNTELCSTIQPAYTAVVS